MAEQVVQLPGLHGVDQVSMTAGSLSLDDTTIPALPLLNSIGRAPNLIDITTWPEGSVFQQGRTGLLLGDGLLFPVHLSPSLDGPDVVGSPAVLS